MKSITDLNLRNQRVLIRVDFNVPFESGVIQDDTRIQASLATIQIALEQGASVILASHLGRPKPGESYEGLSLQPVAQHLSRLLRQQVELIEDWGKGVDVKEGQVALLENIRFHEGETKNEAEFSKQLANLCDVYVNDAFGTAHRAHASTQGITQFVSECCAGSLLSREIDALEKCLSDPARPLVVVLGGAKISGKLETLHNLKDLADTILIGGGIANTFLLANGHKVGKSLVESDLTIEAQKIQSNSNLPLPVDVMTATAISNECSAYLRLVEDIPDSELIVDIGPETARRWSRTIKEAGTVIWNGPMGIDEFKQFGEGTRAIAEACAETQAFSLIGGGDTIASLSRHSLSDQIDYTSTGGGAFLEYIEGKQLPGIAALQ